MFHVASLGYFGIFALTQARLTDPLADSALGALSTGFAGSLSTAPCTFTSLGMTRAVVCTNLKHLTSVAVNFPRPELMGVRNFKSKSNKESLQNAQRSLLL